MANGDLQPKTLDDLIKYCELKGVLDTPPDGEYERGWHDAFSEVVKFTKNNREALELGMQKPLRCYVREYKYDPNSPAPFYETFYQAYPLKKDGEYAGILCMRSATAEGAKSKLVKELDDLGMTAEFVKEPPCQVSGNDV